MHLRVPVAAPVCILVSHFRNLPLMDSRQHAATHTDGSGLGTSNYSRPASATPATKPFLRLCYCLPKRLREQQLLVSKALGSAAVVAGALSRQDQVREANEVISLASNKYSRTRT